MPEPDASQRLIAETLDGMIVVDAGPGTGKTQTIVTRYVNLISSEGVEPRDVLMLTFTRNAANEMEDRIKGRLADEGRLEESKLVQVKTFDSFCLSVVMETPEDAGRLFGIKERLSHAATIVENETLNKAFFSSFLDSFLDEAGEDYGDWGAIACESAPSLYNLINRLMARGIYPMANGRWFGDSQELEGDMDGLLRSMREKNVKGNKANSRSQLSKRFLSDLDPGQMDPLPEGYDLGEVPADMLPSAAFDDRSELIRFVHDVYWHYVERCIVEDRLTFGVNAMLAFSIMYFNEDARRMNSYRYVMIDEFQDTNASQLMMALMVLKEPNLCVVGDWKQGIYGFRFVSVENILNFEERCRSLRDRLNDDGERIHYRIPEAVKLPLTMNYRSSRTVVDGAFRCMTAKATKEEKLDVAAIESRLVRLEAKLDGSFGRNTGIRYIQCGEKDDEPEAVAACIRDYVGSGRYKVVDNGEERPMRLGDIAVLCRNGASCRKVVDHLNDSGIPAFLQGDVEIMATREGKLALAWLRYIGNDQDPWGLVPIMTDMGYSMVEIEAATKDGTKVPLEIKAQRDALGKKVRRVTDLVSSIFAWYGLDNDVTQAIVTVLSSAHRNSLLTVSDLISIIAEDISSGTAYPVELALGAEAVTVMTMHKSKGLEFPTVIIPFMDSGIMPARGTDRSDFTFSAQTGIRSKKTVGRFDGYTKICQSWRTKLARAASDSDYDEERRLMFVAMSRAKQYETLICGPKPSQFIKELSDCSFSDIPEGSELELGEAEPLVEPPDVSGYERRTETLGVHGIMRMEFEDGQGGMSDADEECKKGTQYGTDVHEEAALLHAGLTPSGKYPESKYILEEVLSRRRMDGFVTSYAEIECTLPVLGGRLLLKGVIDLLMVFDDRIEIHDYKTDETDRFQSEYEIQLSVYALAAKGFYRGLPVRCFIDYVSQGRTVEFEPMSAEALDELVAERTAEQ